MNNYIEVNTVPVTTACGQLNTGDMYRLSCNGTCVYMILQKSLSSLNASVNLHTGMVYNLSDRRKVMPIARGAIVSITARGDD